VDDIQFYRKDGTRFYATMYIRGTRDTATGEVVLLDGFVVDTTEHRQTLEIMLQHEKMLMISGLAAGMAHEINNPLGIIAQDLQNLERRLSPALPKNRQIAEELGIDLIALQAVPETARDQQLPCQHAECGPAGFPDHGQHAAVQPQQRYQPAPGTALHGHRACP
jgi:hypothetical protein